MANYSGYNKAQYDNQSAYLQNLINSGTAGQAAWAKNELNTLNSQYTPTVSTTPTPSSTPSSSGTNYSGYTQSQYDNQSAYLNNLISQGGGNAVWAQNELNNLNNQYKPQTPTATPTAPTTPTATTPTGTPSRTFTNSNGTYTVADYTKGNNDLLYALQQAQAGTSVEDYVKSLYNRVGTTNAAGTGVVTLADVDAELNRLGLGDYASDKVIYTVSGHLIPNNEYVSYASGNQGGGNNSANSKWVTYGGQQYLIGGDSANYAQYANAKSGNTDNLSMIFADMMNNPYAQQDQDFLMQYYGNMNNFNNNAGITGNEKVDQIINYVNSTNNFNQATGGSAGGTNLLEMLQSYLDGGLQANQDFLAQQKQTAEKNAEDLARQAWVNSKLQGDDLAQQLSALGLGTSGAVQSAQMGVQNQYNSNIATINSQLQEMINGLSEQELQILTDYYNNMANYAYDVTQYEADQAYRNAQLQLQQQQQLYDQQMAERELAMRQQQYELQNQQYNAETEYSKKMDQANYYADLYNAGQINASELAQVWANLGLVDGQYVRQGQVSTPTTSGGTKKTTAPTAPTTPTAPKASGYSDTVSALKQSGMNGASASNIYTASEFNRRKQAGGTWGGVPLSEFANYQEYLNAVQEFAKSK